RLESTAEKHSLGSFKAAALGVRGRYLVRTGKTVEGIRFLREGLSGQRFEPMVTDFVAELAVTLAKQNQLAEAMCLLDDSIEGQIRGNKSLHLPALFLAKGLAFLSMRPADTQSAAEWFERALLSARQQSATSFELRAGLHLARIGTEHGDERRARELIAPLYNRLTEGFDTPDLIAAKFLLELEADVKPSAA